MKVLLRRGVRKLTGPMLFLFFASEAFGAVTIMIQQVGTDVVATASGTVNTDGLNGVACGTPPCLDGVSGSPVIGNVSGSASIPGLSNIRVGEDPVRAWLYQVGGFDNGNTQLFATGGFFLPDLSSGDAMGVSTGTIPFATGVWVPQNYVSNSPLSGSATYLNRSLADLGLVAGTYIYTFGQPSNPDSLTLVIGSGGPTFGADPTPPPSMDAEPVPTLGWPWTLALILGAIGVAQRYRRTRG